MELTRKRIQEIENHLASRKIRHLDVKHELLDHLASDFLTKNELDLAQYLKSKNSFIHDFVEKKRKSVHWGYQKQLWVLFFSFFYKLKYLYITIIAIATTYFLTFELAYKTSLGIFFISIALLILYGQFYIPYNFKNKESKKLISAQYLSNIMALPSLFLFMLNPIEEILRDNKIILFCFYFLGIMLTIAGTILVHTKRKEVLKKYSYLFK